MRRTRGFTLLETLITTGVLVFGLAAMALIFSYAVRANINTRQRTAATLLLYEKLEELKFTRATDSSLSPGEYLDYPTIAETPYLRTWSISDTTPKSITVVVSAGRAGLTGRPMELIRAATLVTSTF